MNIRTILTILPLRASRKGLVIGATALAVLSGPGAHACDSCNYSFQDQILTARADTLAGRDMLAAMTNQAGLPLEGLSNVSFGTPNEMRSKLAGKESWATTHGKEILYNDDDFIEIIERDYTLPLAPTSYVPQDAIPDKRFTIELAEGNVYLGNGVVYSGFHINGKIPGPTMIMDEGDIIEMTVINKGTVPHGASIHAAYTQTSKYVGKILPGETRKVLFRATHPGVYMYHCAPGGHAIPMHVIFGQYGMMVVKPKHTPYKLEQILGHPPDAEIYLVQHEWYASGKDGVEGNATYTTFNGKLFRYVEDPIKVKPGDYVRLHFLNVGPNLLSTFHIVGILWDYAYWQGRPEAVQPGGQSLTAGPSDSWVVEFRVPPDEGAYLMLSHAVGATSRGAIGVLAADRDAETPVVVTADGPEYSEEEMTEITEQAVRVISPFAIGTPDVDPVAVYDSDDKEVTVRIIGNSFSPKSVQVTPGTTITWINEDVFAYMAGEFAGIHNAVATNGPESFVSPLLAHAETFSFTFTKEGTYDYMCTPHPYMKGKIVVAGEPAEAVAMKTSLIDTDVSEEQPDTADADPAEPEIASGPITITADDMMKFNIAEFAVEAGSEVTIVFQNLGKMPKEAMGHNLVILAKGTDPMAFATASIRFPNEEYVSPDMKDSVVAFTRVLGPGESETLTFTAPAEAGDYPFVCSFPGHTPVGMRGLMKVK